MPLSNDPTDPFDRFMAAFPERDGGHDYEQARQAWSRAVQLASPEALIAAAEAYACAVEGRPRRYVMSVRRWLNECRWRDVVTSVDASGHQAPEPFIWIAYGTPAWNGQPFTWPNTERRRPRIEGADGGSRRNGRLGNPLPIHGTRSARAG
jgi:hypothetical protein